MSGPTPAGIEKHLAEVRNVSELPVSPGGMVDLDAAAGPLLAALRASVESGQREEAFDVVRKAVLGAEEGSASKQILFLAYLRVNDHAFWQHGVDGLTVRRIDLENPERVPLEDLDILLEVTSDGGFVPKTKRPDERPLANVSCALQLLVGTSDDYTLEKEPPGLDLLEAATATLLRHGNVRRVAWGVGQCLLTDQRAVGLIHTDIGETPGGKELPPDEIGPFALIEGPGGSVIVFSAERSVFAEADVDDVPLFKRRPHIELIGAECVLTLTTHAILDERNRLRKPSKGEIAEAARAFVPRG